MNAPSEADAPAAPPAGDERIRTALEEVRGIGLLLFDLRARAVVFRNREAELLFRRAGIEPEFAALAPLFDIDAPAAAEPHALKLGGRIVGYSVYGDEATRLVICRDVSEKERATSIGEALEAASGLGHLFSAVRHEIANPINSVKTALTVLRDGYDRFPRAEVLGYLDRTLAELARMEEILHALRTFAMQEPIRPREVPLAGLLDAFEEAARAEAAAAGVALEVAIEAGIGEVEADPAALRRVLQGLLANALNAAGGRAFARVRVRAAPRDHLVEIRVEDNGRGMSPGDLKELFHPFAVRRPGRLGLGLVIARKLLAEMNGTIAVESVEGSGTTVVLTLRRARGAG